MTKLDEMRALAEEEIASCDIQDPSCEASAHTLARHVLSLLAVAESARLKRNSRWNADKKFEGEWIVIPKEDFDALRSALAELEKETT